MGNRVICSFILSYVTSICTMWVDATIKLKVFQEKASIWGSTHWKMFGQVLACYFHPCVCVFFCWQGFIYCCKNMAGEIQCYVFQMYCFKYVVLDINEWIIVFFSFFAFAAGHRAARVYLWSGSGSVWSGQGCIWCKRVLARYSGGKRTKNFRSWVFPQTMGFRWDNAKVFDTDLNHAKYMTWTSCYICSGSCDNRVNLRPIGLFWRSGESLVAFF